MRSVLRPRSKEAAKPLQRGLQRPRKGGAKEAVETATRAFLRYGLRPRRRVTDFRILGPLELFDESGERAIRSRKQRALLAILLLHAGTVVSRDWLIDALWEGEPPATAASALRVHVAELRKLLEQDEMTGGCC